MTRIAQIRKFASERHPATKIAQFLRISADKVRAIAAAHGIALEPDPVSQKKPSSAYARNKPITPPDATVETWATDGRADVERFGGYVNGVWVPGTHRVPFRVLADGEELPARVASAEPPRAPRTKGPQPMFRRRAVTSPIQQERGEEAEGRRARRIRAAKVAAPSGRKRAGVGA